MKMHMTTGSLHYNRRAALTVACLAPAMLVVAACGRQPLSQHSKPVVNPVRPQTSGRAALESEAQRTVEVKLSDEMRFDPAQITVKMGEIITFHLVNTGKQEHEVTIGDANAQELHDYEMTSMNMSAMHHGDMSHLGKAHQKYMDRLSKRTAELDRLAGANASMHVPPGQSRDLAWAFSGQQLPVYGCHLPGHWAAGMKGTFIVP
jgi:uncharacterized cupredoxin-like copper-binding protein